MRGGPYVLSRSFGIGKNNVLFRVGFQEDVLCVFVQ